MLKRLRTALIPSLLILLEIWYHAALASQYLQRANCRSVPSATKSLHRLMRNSLQKGRHLRARSQSSSIHLTLHAAWKKLCSSFTMLIGIAVISSLVSNVTSTSLGIADAMIRYFSSMEPWALSKRLQCSKNVTSEGYKATKRRLDTILYLTIDAARLSGKPAVPQASTKILDYLLVPPNKRTFAEATFLCSDDHIKGDTVENAKSFVAFPKIHKQVNASRGLSWEFYWSNDKV
ncbi:hypothetical protein PsorP6_017945 [Peronosclerospora sorghi]|uniref:Uncharacterized protein n=1 Tax=Peronosclerospora sorghi TaxID=230839 RepID=A0ACC0WDW1_9STRA|nr:hypothetical protein PsorP6_017945 [Peronosclerospora sorghi]